MLKKRKKPFVKGLPRRKAPAFIAAARPPATEMLAKEKPLPSRGASRRTEPAAERLNFRIPPKLKLELKVLAESRGISMTECVLELIERAVAEARKKGLIDQSS